MAEVKKAEVTKKKSWFHRLKSEFNKIIWTDKETLVKQTIAVIAITTIVAVMIVMVDEVAMSIVNVLTH